MKTHPELGLDPPRNGSVLAVLSGVEVGPRPGRLRHPVELDQSRVVLPNQKAKDAIDLTALLSGHNYPVAARVINKTC